VHDRSGQGVDVTGPAGGLLVLIQARPVRAVVLRTLAKRHDHCVRGDADQAVRAAAAAALEAAGPAEPAGPARPRPMAPRPGRVAAGVLPVAAAVAGAVRWWSW
jgi:hypothetical protein